MRSTQEGRPYPEKVGASPESLPGRKTEVSSSESSQAKVSSTASTLLESFSESQAWENKDTATWSLVPCFSETPAMEGQTKKAQDWGTQTCEAQINDSQSKQTSIFEMEETAPVLKQKPSLKKMDVPEKEEHEVVYSRPLWSNKFEYILAHLGYSMRAVNQWRFAHMWLHHGGWSFFIIYIFLTFLIGIPLLFLEMAVGQRMRQGSIGAWKIICPWVGGVGYTNFMVCLITAIYLNVVNAWTLSYLSQSFQFSVPWEHCPLLKNSSDFDPECARTTPSMYFWYRMTLKATDKIEDGGPPVFSSFLPLFVSWCIVGAFMINGLKSIGKVLCILVPTSYIIMICFVIRSVLLDGVKFGLQYLALVKISAMYNVKVWCHAGILVLLALGLGYGPIVSLASHIELSNNCLRDAFLVALVNLGLMMITTTFIFCVLGFWSTVITYNCNVKNAEILSRLVDLGKLPPEAQPPLFTEGNLVFTFTSWLNKLPQPIKSMVVSQINECNLEKQFMKVTEGPNFIFLAFIEAMSFTPGSVFWSILFFLMFLNTGLCVVMTFLQNIITSLQDSFSSFRKHEKLLTVVVFVLMFLCSFYFIRPQGLYQIRLLSDYWIVFPVIIVMFETIAVGWACGARRFLTDFATLWDRPIHPIFHWLWCYLCPVVLLFLSITTLILLFLKDVTYTAWDSSSSKEVIRRYSTGYLLMLGAVSLAVMLPIPTCFLYCLVHGIPFKPVSLNRPLTSSKSLPLIIPLKPIKEDQKEETLQGVNQTADPPVV
uniref:Solute carrier family 6 member 16 n=1 Tax=Molossus molossus TaxID=27622 RepID=A0A7J8CB98_MOLMO|nr:hypothetical protein HJG59_016879 [Molossus molossus]